MRLVCSEAGLALLDAERFDGFAVEAPAGLSLAGLGAETPVLDEGREEVDVPAGRVRELAGELGLPHRWLHDFDAMLARVAPFGWYDADRDLLRAHVVRTS